MSKGKLVSGVLIGAAAGALLGILLAPDKGSETRKKLNKKGSDFGSNVKNKFNDFVDGLASKFEDVKSEAESTMYNAKNKASNKVDEIERSIS
jgi:gas vesicle protein